MTSHAEHFFRQMTETCHIGAQECVMRNGNNEIYAYAQATQTHTHTHGV